MTRETLKTRPQPHGVKLAMCGNCKWASGEGVTEALARMAGPRVRIAAFSRICEPESGRWGDQLVNTWDSCFCGKWEARE